MRYLVVANLTLGGDALLQVLRDRVGPGDARLHLLVPASHGPQGWHSHDEASDAAAARQRLERARSRFRDLGAAEVTTEMGTARVVDCIGDVIRHNAGDPFDEIILSTLPLGPSRWLAMDLPSRITRAHGIPLTHVTATEEEDDAVAEVVDDAPPPQPPVDVPAPGHRDQWR